MIRYNELLLFLCTLRRIVPTSIINNVINNVLTDINIAINIVILTVISVAKIITVTIQVISLFSNFHRRLKIVTILYIVQRQKMSPSTFDLSSFVQKFR